MDLQMLNIRRKNKKVGLEDNDVSRREKIKKIIPVNNDKGNDYLNSYLKKRRTKNEPRLAVPSCHG